MSHTELKTRLDEATTDRRLLDHPFYKAWAAGTLTVDDLSFYSTQYWRQVEAFPGYLETLAARTPGDGPRTVIEENLRDEVDGDHLGLWLEFAAGVGATRERVLGSEALPETTECVTAFGRAASERSLPFALGMLYAYESQTPGVAATKIEGLRNHYGIDGPALEYFAVHGELDVDHSDDLAKAIADLATDDAAKADAEAGAKAGADAIWGLLTGIARERGIDCTN
ncbi:MAG TPA: iron-containing redox enzyme family protein [Actinomycetota bacterium]|nr:iron-containing redox enzyme family protein [Actinomycetota bacterium]